MQDRRRAMTEVRASHYVYLRLLGDKSIRVAKSEAVAFVRSSGWSDGVFHVRTDDNRVCWIEECRSCGAHEEA